TTDGVALNEFIRTLCGEAILTARGGVLVDWDEKADRPYFALYVAESIINWSDDGVVLNETVYDVDPEDAYKLKAVNQIRQLQLVEGVYTVTIWRERAEATIDPERWFVYQQMTPTKRGATMNEIPFFWLSPLGKTRRVTKPPLLGLVNVAMSHYRTSADLEHGRHFCGMPTLWVAGMQN